MSAAFFIAEQKVAGRRSGLSRANKTQLPSQYHLLPG